MKASSLYFLGFITVTIPSMILQYLENPEEELNELMSWNFTDLIPLVLGIAFFFFVTRFLDNRYEVTRKGLTKQTKL